MNKSLALKNKLYLFFLLLTSLFIFFYLFYFLINGDRGIISYFKIKKQNFEYQVILSDLQKKNIFLADRVERLQTNTIDLDFLDEVIRRKKGFLEKNELLIIFD